MTASRKRKAGEGATRTCRPFIVEGEFQSDKYPTCPRGKVPLSTKDPTAQDLLWQYAQRRRAVDAQFADDLEEALRLKGYAPTTPNAGRPTLTVEQFAEALASELEGHIDYRYLAPIVRRAVEAALKGGGE